ncbi:MAG: hypothetical protein HY667_05400 [Chloroflexi bacterium]|nr:hypothetical protein [Chloroflexota bacterium]
MSEKIYCSKCNMLLYFDDQIARRLYMRAIPSEDTALGYYHNVCPRCVAELSRKSVKVEIGAQRHGTQ